MTERESHGRLRLLAVAAGAGAVSLVLLAGGQALAARGGRPGDSGQVASGDAGENYFVATWGSDSPGGGTATNPWATIGYAAERVNVTDQPVTVHVAGGTYTSTVTNTKSGKPGAYLTFLSDDRWGARIWTGGSDNHGFPFLNRGDYVRVKGFDVTSTVAFTGILSYGAHNIIEGNQVHDIQLHECDGSPGGAGIGTDQSAHDNVIIGNVVHNVGWYPSRCDYTHGIYPSGAGDIVQNNISYHNAGSGFSFNHNGSGATFANNLSFANLNHGISIASQDGTGDNFVITNNILRDNAMYGVNVHTEANGAHNQYRSNLFYQNGKGRYGLANSDEFTPPNTSGTISADPKLVDYRTDGSGDYRLTAGSPAVDVGVSLGAPATDYDGNVRPQGIAVDVGPFEYGASAPPTTTPTTTPPTTTPTTTMPTTTPPTTTPPTTTPPASPPPGDTTIGFEDGTTQGWSGYYGNAGPTVVADVAYEGGHALRFHRSTGGHSAVGTSRGVGTLRIGSQVTYHVWADQDGTSVRPFVRDQQYNAVLVGAEIPLPARQWITVTWYVPSVPSVGSIGLDASDGPGTVVIDALTWPMS